MRTPLLLSFLLLSVCLCATDQRDLDSLDYYLSKKELFDAAKQERISRIRLEGNNELLFDEYASYIYDSASMYSLRMIDESLLSGNKDFRTIVQIKRGFLYLSGGLFKEAADILEDLDLEGVSDEVKIEYYTTYGRLLYDLSDYNHSDLANEYLMEGNTMTDNALALLEPQDNARFWYLSALRDMKRQNYTRALERFARQLQCDNISVHDKAITYSSMAWVYRLQNDMRNAQHYNILAAIYDIKGSTKEAVALQNVARVLFMEGQIERAAKYIRIANDDAQFYNARHRKQEISELLPIIEGEQMRQINEKNRRIETLSFFLYILLAIVIAITVVLYNRMTKLSKAQHTIHDINLSLREANKIKEEYLGTFLCWQSDFLNQLERYQRFVKKKAQEKKYEELQTLPQQFNANKKRQEFNKQFDEMFLRVFPDYVQQFNDMLREDERFEMKKGELLNTELRIFALIRLGITDNEKIAQVLDYSVTTIYTYKTRVRNRSDLSSDELTQRLMSIG